MEGQRSRSRPTSPPDFSGLDDPDESVLSIARTLSVPRDPNSWLDLGGDEDQSEAVQPVAIPLRPSTESRRTRPSTSRDGPADAPSSRRRLSSRRKKPSSRAPPPALLRLSSASSNPDDDSRDDDDNSAAHAELNKREVSSEGSSVASFEAHTPSSASTDFNIAVRDNSHSELESLLLSTSRANSACLVTPSAGPFYEHLIAFVSYADPSPTDSRGTVLPPSSDHEDESCRDQIESLRAAVQEWGPDTPRPSIWIILQCMPMGMDGAPDSATLQTWVENMDRQTEQRIMAWQHHRHSHSTVGGNHNDADSNDDTSQRTKQPSWPEYLSTVWNEDEAGTLGAHNTLTSNDSEFFALSPMQHLYFRTSVSRRKDPTIVSEPEYRFGQSILLQVRSTDISLADVEAAVEALSDRHSMLRARFYLTPEGWAQIIAPEGRSSYRFSHGVVQSDEDVLAIMEQAQASINALDGPVFSVDHIRRSDDQQLLHLVAHHLIVDLPSWRIIVHDLDDILQHRSVPAPNSMPFPHWIEYQNHMVSQRKPNEPALPFTITPANFAYWDLRQNHGNCYGDVGKTLRFTLDADITHNMHTACASVLRADAADMMIAGLLHSFRLTFPDRTLPTIWKQEHGRDAVDPDVNINATVGWFTSLCPVAIATDETNDFIQVLKMVMFNCVDNLQNIHRKGGVLEPIAAPGGDDASLMSDIGPRVGRIALFEVSVVIDDDIGARVEVLFNKKSQHQDRIANWIRNFEQAIMDGISRLGTMEPELTLADMPLLKASYQGMTKLTVERLSQLALDSVDDIETVYPVSPIQQEILIAQSQDMDCYHVQSIYELTTPHDVRGLDQARLCSSWEKLCAMHPTLRSVFIDSVSENGLFDQVVLKRISAPMLFLDSAKPDETLAALPPMRTVPGQPRHRLSVCTVDKRTFVRLDASQAICDPISIRNLIGQLRQMYMGEPIIIDKTLNPRYLGHINRQDKTADLEAWKQVLLHARPCTFPSMTLQCPENLQSRSFQLEVTRTELYSRSRSRQVEPSIAIRLAWALVLRAFVGMDRVTFGFLLAGRDEDLSPAMDAAVGCFAPVLPCYVDLSPDQSVHDCLQSLAEFSANIGPQYLTVMDVQHALNLKGDDLFNTCISFMDEEQPEKDTPKGGFVPVLITAARSSECKISLSTTFTGDQLHVNLSYRHLTATQAYNIIGTFEQALKAVLYSDDRQTISSLSLFTDRDYAQLVVRDLESTLRGEEVTACLHKQIFRHVASRPDAQAICAWDGNMTYRQLDTFVTRLSKYLVNVGVKPGYTVPIALEKSKWLPVVMLSILEAGGCFISLDHQDTSIVESSMRHLNPSIIIASETAAWAGASAVIIGPDILNDIFLSPLPPQGTAIATEPTPDHAACVFFTPSKSKTGNARSIFFTHKSLCSAFAAQGRALGIQDTSRVFQLSACSGDIALVETLGTMYQGGCVCIPHEEEKIPELAASMAQMQVTWSYMTSVLARRIVPSTVPALRTLCFRTRSLDQDTYGPWMENRTILLAYGAPDVCPLGISVTDISYSNMSSIIPPPLLGRFWILNPDDPKKLMPVGAMGELGIDSPVITPHKFYPGHPTMAVSSNDQGAEKPRGRYLKTGHRVRYLDDGNIQFISSMRDEIVIGGLPVFVTAVEQCIRRCIGPKIDVAVDMITTSDSIQVLVAYLELGEQVFQGPTSLDKLEVSMKEVAFRHKKMVEATMANIREPSKRVPMHHIPTAFVPLKHFPISTSLKVNKRKLQKTLANLSHAQLMDLSTVSNPAEVLRAEKPLPLTQGEEMMRRIWAQTLGKTPIDIKGSDSFLSVGGDKYLAIKMVVACRQFGFIVSLRDILSAMTLTEVCQAIAAADSSFNNSRGASELKNLPTRVTGFDDRFIKDILSPQLTVHWHDILDVTEASAWQVRSLELGLYKTRGDIQNLVLRFNGPIKPGRLEGACNALTKLHPILRTAFAVHDRRVYQILIDSFKPTFQRKSCALTRLDFTCQEVIQQDQEQLELKLNEPATKFTLVEAPYQAILILRVSSAQVDEASVSLLVQDLISLYDDRNSVQPKSNFFDYMRTAHAINFRDGMEYWKEQLTGVAKMTQITPHSKPCGPVLETKTIYECVKIKPVDGIGFDTILKASWATVLAILSGTSDVIFGELIHGYNIALPETIDVTSLVGPLANTIPVRVGFPPKNSRPIDLMQFLQEQRIYSRPFESAGFLELVQQCTNWAYWTRFSSLVHHRFQAPMDGTTTLNMGDTTFTYKLIAPMAKDIPDLYVCSTLNGPSKVDITITYPESRVSTELARNAMKLLLGTLETMTGLDSQYKPMLPSAADIERTTPQIPLQRRLTEDEKSPVVQMLTADQRAAVQNLVQSAWTEILNPLALGVPEAQVERANFYDLWGSLLTAYFFADYFNREIPKLKLKGLEKVKIIPEDIIEHPNMASQHEFLATKMFSAGALQSPSRRFTNSLSTSSGIWAPTIGPWRSIRRGLRHQESRTSVRDFHNKASDWMRLRVNSNRDVVSPSTPEHQSTRKDTIRELHEEYEPVDDHRGSSDRASSHRRSNDHDKARPPTAPVEMGPSHRLDMESISPLTTFGSVPNHTLNMDERRAVMAAAAAAAAASGNDSPIPVSPMRTPFH
ncbi:hypothetical protein B0I35DRAFT_411425 [Stachybotrys elegans]|uniref:Carrier domain-containing protein n=1 Tax=Stachybotrys elegans TaxID=80388 RepID=A0A8K0WQ09_9HYPO|nr:hypothetical protein B0I35DRAFT_411425 [Stachybotrys elegans]